MKTEIKRRTVIKTPAPAQTFENEISRFMRFMVRTIRQRFENMVIDELPDHRFQDSRGNYARQFERLTRQVRQSIVRQFGDDRIEQLTHEILHRTNKRNRRIFYKEIEEKIGIDTDRIVKQEGLTWENNALVAETMQWIKSLRDSTLEDHATFALRAMATGASRTAVVQEAVAVAANTGRRSAETAARTQIQTYNSLSTRLRALNLGIERARWITSRDGKRVRRSHRDRDGKLFNLRKGLYSALDRKTLLPGVDYNCRCTYELVLDRGDVLEW